jgi:hypothetical protein
MKTAFIPLAVFSAMLTVIGIEVWNGPPTWSGKGACGLARFAFERYGKYTRHDTFEEFISAGVGFRPANSDRTIVVMIVGDRRNPSGRVFAEEI